ncbi:response regulator transcription factor [Kribbella sp. NPDC005582]|uniref:response regulator transcription factor n=1 Tax=Kribbella sp. NPDC005582 TaxID=3156893 RepID=UPI0033A8F37D
MSSPVRLLLVDDDPLVRAGLASMLGGTPAVQLVGEAANGREAVDAVRELCPDVVLMDIGMPVLDGVAATAEIRRYPDAVSGVAATEIRRRPDAVSGVEPPTDVLPEVLILTTFGSDDHLLAALRAGAAGYLLKDAAPAEIVTAVLKVAAGESVLSSQSTRQLMAHAAHTDHDTRRTAAVSALSHLTAREQDVVQAVAEGKSNPEIAEALQLGVATVKTHLTNALAKLQLTNRVQLALLAHDADLV